MDQSAIRMFELQHMGYCCSQVLLIIALEAQGKENPDLVRAAAGLCNGLGYTGDVCGALLGGTCLLSLYAAKGAEDEETDDRLPKILFELVDWFKEQVGKEYGGITCDDVLTKRPDKSACGPIVYRTYLKAVDIVTSNGFDPAKGRG
jgi:hypothetical protein